MSTDIAVRVKTFFNAYPRRAFDKGETIVQAGEKPTGVFYIVEGQVSQYDIASSGVVVVVNVFKPEAFFPMSFAVNDTHNYYFFEASTKKVVTRIAPSAETIEFLKMNPDILFDLLSRVFRGMDGVLRRMAHLMGGNAKGRLTFELLNAAYRFGKTRSDKSVFVPLKEGDLARRSGLARETVNRVMHDLKDKGFVEVSRSGITLKSIDRLESLLNTEL